MITNDGSVKFRNAERLVDGRPGAGRSARSRAGFWLTLEGSLRVSRDPAEVTDALDRAMGNV